MRLRGLIRKEFLQIVRDPSSIGIALLLPAVLLFLFGYGISLDAKHVPVAVVLEDTGPEAKNFAAELGGSEYLRPLPVSDMAAAQELMTRHKVKAIVRIRQDFARRLQSGDGAIQVIADGVDANYRRLLGDRHWPLSSSLADTLRYFPAPLALVRVLKSETVIGLQPGQPGRLSRQDPGWMTDGKWGLVQFWQGG